MKEDNTLKSAMMYIKYINGWEHTYDLKNIHESELKEHLETYNEILEGIRGVQNFDDEFEDEIEVQRIGDKAGLKFERNQRKFK